MPPQHPGIRHPNGPYRPPRAKKSPVALILVLVGALVVLGGGAATVLYFVLKDPKIAIQEPVVLSGRPKITSDLPLTLDLIKRQTDYGSGFSGYEGYFYAAYGDLAANDVIKVYAMGTPREKAELRFDRLLANLNQRAPIVPLIDTTPGPFGGIAKCGEARFDGGTSAICLWSDRGSVGFATLVVQPGRTRADLEREFVSIRNQVEFEKD